jgi:hypothetical protein
MIEIGENLKDVLCIIITGLVICYAWYLITRD